VLLVQQGGDLNKAAGQCRLHGVQGPPVLRAVHVRVAAREVLERGAQPLALAVAARCQADEVSGQSVCGGAGPRTRVLVEAGVFGGVLDRLGMAYDGEKHASPQLRLVRMKKGS
jgi:hypothetical protein